MGKKKILIVGSSNTDMVIKTSHLPRPGETILGGAFFMNPGGKGANQAVAAARLGGEVVFISKTGNDLFGIQSVQLFKDEGIDTSCMLTDPELPSGVALITVDANAENCITVASGANANLLPEDFIDKRKVIDTSDIVLMQLEIPISTVNYIAKKASNKNKMVILNPAPAQSLSKDLLQRLYLITPNETEAEFITGIQVVGVDSAKAAAEKIRKMGVENVVITMGAKGALIYSDVLCEMIPATKVESVDTTAAGDIFNGALAVALSNDANLKDAVRFASNAAAISVTRFGAQSSAPYKNEINFSY